MSLIKNSWFNVLGVAIPSLVAIPSMGFMARTLDREVFGLLTLAVAFLGYSVIFDGGLSRSVIREVSIYRKNKEELLRIIGSAARLSLILGVFFSVLLIVLSENITGWLNVTDIHRDDAVDGLWYLALCIPIVLLTAVLTALLEGQEDFRSVNLVRVFGFTLVFLLPPLLISLSSSFSTMACGLLMARVLMLALAYRIFYISLGAHPVAFSRTALVRLYRFGGWLTISNIIGPIMEYFDRFIIASTNGSAVVVYYTAPAELTMRLLSLPGALSRSLFPAINNGASADTKLLVLRAIAYQLVVVLAISSFVLLFSYDILRLWLGIDFALQSRDVLMLFMVGFFFN
jgi:O-antigen/teichoic acid export membrane protein